jgi:hypothetical protein
VISRLLQKGAVTLSVRDFTNKPSANPDLDWINRNTVVWQRAGNEAQRYARRKQEAIENCEIKLGDSPENEIGNVSPNATNISR